MLFFSKSLQFARFFCINKSDLHFNSILHDLQLFGSSISSTEMVFCYQNCSDLLWEKKCSSDQEKLLKFEAEGWEFAKIFEITRTIYWGFSCGRKNDKGA